MSPALFSLIVMRMIVAVPVYLFKAVLVVALKLLTFIVAPFIALPPFVVMLEENATTGYPSQFPGKPRAFLVRLLRGFQTHDDCLDAMWYSGKYRYTWLKRFDQDDFDTKWYVRYFCYVAWLWRNPAYKFADMLGWRNKDYKILASRDEDALWKTGTPNFSYWIVQNDRGSIAFQIQGQFYYFKGKRWCLEYVLGYGFTRFEPDDKCMVNVRLIPWRRYPK